MIKKLYNAKILTDAYAQIFDGEIAIEDDKIIYVGNKFDGRVDEQIDCNGNLLMSGFVNCHTHSAMTLLKGLGEDESLENWLFKFIMPREKTLTKQDVYNGSVLAIKEMLKNGITCFQDNYFYPKQTAKACQDLGIRAVVSLSQNYSPSKFLTKSELEKLYLDLKDKYPLVNYNFYCHSTYTCNEQQFFDTISLAKKYGKLVSTHSSETLTEVGECTQTHNGQTPTMLLNSFGFFDVKSTFAHGVHLQKEDYEILKDKNTSVVHNPSSNLKLGSGIANLKALLQNGINICLGTDGSASNNRLDMFREMFLASSLQKAIFNDPKLISCSQALAMATQNGAKALGLEKIGTLRVNNYADIIMIDLAGIDNAIKNDIKSNLVYACSSEDVLMTMINGKIVYKK